MARQGARFNRMVVQAFRRPSLQDWPGTSIIRGRRSHPTSIIRDTHHSVPSPFTPANHHPDVHHPRPPFTPDIHHPDAHGVHHPRPPFTPANHHPDVHQPGPPFTPDTHQPGSPFTPANHHRDAHGPGQPSPHPAPSGEVPSKKEKGSSSPRMDVGRLELDPLRGRAQPTGSVTASNPVVGVTRRIVRSEGWCRITATAARADPTKQRKSNIRGKRSSKR